LAEMRVSIWLGAREGMLVTGRYRAVNNAGH
jgi:hypothetical protein